MAIRGRVGRHVKTNKNCQNWKADQKVVTELLNRISIADGGAEGALNAPIIGGIASQSLYTSILYFQNKHFPRDMSGFIDPSGPMLAKLESLAAKPTPAPPTPRPKSELWDNITDPAFKKAMTAAMADDNKIDYDEAIEIVRHVLSDGFVSPAEINDLESLAKNSKSLPTAARDLIKSFVFDLKWEQKNHREYRLSDDKHQFAVNMVCDFLKRSGRVHFKKLNRYEVGVGLLMRLANPGLIRQGEASLCGPAALLFNIANSTPILYVRYAIDLFEKGKASLGRIYVNPGSDVRNYSPPGAQVDWLTMASLRDSENWFLDYDSAGKELAGITLPGELMDWFRKAGYRDVREDTNLSAAFTKGKATIDEANRLLAAQYCVCLFIGASMLEEKNQAKKGSIADRHWVVQRTRIEYAGDNVSFKVFTWGDGEYKVPEGSKRLSYDQFTNNFYGYVAAKP